MIIRDLVLRHVDECIDVVVVSANVLVFDQPLDLFFYHLFTRQKHILEYIDEFRL